MNARLIATTLAVASVLGVGTGIASYYVGRDSAARPAGDPVPLFLASAQQSDPGPTWPTRSGAVAFNDEIIALLTVGATMSGSAQQAMAQGTAEAQPPKRMTRRERRRLLQQEERARQRADRAYDAHAKVRGSHGRVAGDNVEVRVFDRYGNKIRTRRVESEVEADRPRAYAPGPFRQFGPFGNR